MPLETEIARALTARFGEPLTTRCELPIPRCTTELADGTVLPIRVTPDGSGWSWQLDGLVVDTAPIAHYLDGMLADLHVAQTASCGARVRRVQPGERLACSLSGGGTAFVDVAAGGAISVELALDRQAAAARGEPASPEHERELDRLSHALDHGTDADDP